MEYRYFGSDNYEVFASGRVIIHQTGKPGYPCRLAGEVFSRSLSYLDEKENLCVYDPCCGGGHLLTVLGMLFPSIRQIYGSDIAADALALAQSNLSLLTAEGLERRRVQLEKLNNAYGKASHHDALDSVAEWADMLSTRPNPVSYELFEADILDGYALADRTFQADIVIVDLPYGKMAEWSGTDAGDDAADKLLDTIAPVLQASSVVAVSFDKKQRVHNKRYTRLEKYQAGKRRIELLRLS